MDEIYVTYVDDEHVDNHDYDDNTDDDHDNNNDLYGRACNARVNISIYIYIYIYIYILSRAAITGHEHPSRTAYGGFFFRAVICIKKYGFQNSAR